MKSERKICFRLSKTGKNKIKDHSGENREGYHEQSHDSKFWASVFFYSVQILRKPMTTST